MLAPFFCPFTWKSKNQIYKVCMDGKGWLLIYLSIVWICVTSCVCPASWLFSVCPSCVSKLWHWTLCAKLILTISNSFVPGILKDIIGSYHFMPVLKVTRSVESKTSWSQFPSYFSTDQDEIWCVEAVQLSPDTTLEWELSDQGEWLLLYCLYQKPMLAGILTVMNWFDSNIMGW